MTSATENKGEMQRWQARSRRVAITRRLLPALIALIVLAMVGFVVFRTLAPGQVLTAKAGAPTVNPRIHGRDEKDRPFLIGAIQAIRDELDAKRIVLNEPFVTLGDGRLSAKAGIYSTERKSLTLQGQVLFDDGNGTRLTTDQAVIDTKKGVISGAPQSPNGGVKIESPNGQLRADSYAVYDQGRRVELKGNVQGQINGSFRR